MVKLKGPGLARAASGSLADELTFSNWKGVSYLKQHRKPKQPNTPAQISMRAMMRFVSGRWAIINAADRTTWEIPAAAKNISPFNAYQAVNLTRWRNFLDPSKSYPAPEGGDVGGITAKPTIPGVRSFTASWYCGPLADIWGMALSLVPASGVPPTWDNLLHITPITSTGTYYQLLTGFEPGCWWIALQRLLLTGERAPYIHYRCGNVTD